MFELRLIRIRQFLREQISRIVLTLKDPALQTGLVTITDLEVTPDLRHAQVSYSVLGSADARRACGEALTRAAPFIRRELLRVTELRRAPELAFLYDESPERASRIFQLLAQIEREPREVKTARRAKRRGREGGASPASKRAHRVPHGPRAS